MVDMQYEILTCEKKYKSSMSLLCSQEIRSFEYMVIYQKRENCCPLKVTKQQQSMQKLRQKNPVLGIHT